MMKRIQIKSADGIYEDRFLEHKELCEYFKKNTDDDGLVLEEMILFQECEVKSADDTITIEMSNSKLDRQRERMDAKGWNIREYKKNSIILWAHDQKIPAIGKMNNVKVVDDKLIGQAQFTTNTAHPYHFVGELVKEGILKGGSVGFKPVKVEIKETQDGPILWHREQELYEYSIVNVPALPSSGVKEETDERIKALEKTLDVLREELEPEKKNELVEELFGDKGNASPNENSDDCSFKKLYDSKSKHEE